MSNLSFSLQGKILYLTSSSSVLQQQIWGEENIETLCSEDLESLSFHYGVNTDAMISGKACTFGYTPEILGPYFLENFKEVVHCGDIQQGGFQVVVGGDAYGTGSSREAAVVAHQGAGVELVIAKSFQRIFQENMVYVGLPFSSDFSYVKRLQAGEEISITTIHEELPLFFKQVALQGGLLSYGTAWLEGKIEPCYSCERQNRPLNVVEKIISAKTWIRGNHTSEGGLQLGVAEVSPGDQVLCSVGFRGMHEYTAGMCMALYEQEFGEYPVYMPEQVAAFEDHFVLIDQETVPKKVKDARLKPAKQLAQEMIDACEKYNLRLHGPNRDYDAGVCHRIVVEQYAKPSDIVVLTDSHTPTSGVLNTFAFGVGSTAMTFALRTGLIPVTVPKVVRIVIEGRAHEILSPKDLILHIIGMPYFREEHWRSAPTDTCVLQFGGSGLKQWNVDELSVLTNMTVEGGLMTGVVEPCDAIVEFLQESRGVDYSSFLVYPDQDAQYERVITIDLQNVPLTVASPGDSRNRVSLEELQDVEIQNVVIASCTGGSLSDLRAAAAVLSGRKLAKGVRLTVTPSSKNVEDQARNEGIMKIFESVGAVISPPGCGSCIGNGPGIPLPNETTVSTTNRNYDRRMGAPGPVYLVSPAVAAATAIFGKITDPRTCFESK
jgi:3-isopropylmalate/(R)-2-methylmalate dehydratase large subunit